MGYFVWLALVLAIVALGSAPSMSEFSAVKARLEALENKKCQLMAVQTPTGSASICVP